MDRKYLRITTERGKWYVSYYGYSTKTVEQDIMRNLRACIVGGPFPTKDAARAWLDAQPALDGPMSIVWQERSA